MSKKQLFYIVFFSVLVVGFFITLSAVVPGFVKQKVAPVSHVLPFSFVNQDGQLVNEKVLEGKVAAVNFFFTTCRGICPRMTNNLKPVYEAFRDEPDFVMLSHTCDPSRDSVPVLRRYADSIGVNVSKWIFLTGAKDSLYSAARYSYKIDDPSNFGNGAESDFLHTQFIALVDRQGDVVAVYDGIRPSEINEMKSRIRKLLKQ
ncbi:MAG TPA: SCO family protein [Flavisolibacter sp.]